MSDVPEQKEGRKKRSSGKSSGKSKDKKKKREERVKKAFEGPTKIDLNEIQLGEKLVCGSSFFPPFLPKNSLFLGFFFFFFVCLSIFLGRWGLWLCVQRILSWK